VQSDWCVIFCLTGLSHDDGDGSPSETCASTNKTAWCQKSETSKLNIHASERFHNIVGYIFFLIQRILNSSVNDGNQVLRTRVSYAVK
jgi:hypothetical protein